MYSSQRHTQGLQQTSKIKSFATIVNGVWLLTIIAKLSILYVFGDLDNAFAIIRQQLLHYLKKALK